MPTCTKALSEKVAAMIKVGVPPIVATKAHGIDEADFVEWMRKGQLSGAGHGNYRQFYEMLCKAEGDFEAGLIGTIAVASIEDWKAAAWLAERRFPERYVRKSVGDAAAAKKPGAPGEADPWDSVDKAMPLKVVK